MPSKLPLSLSLSAVKIRKAIGPDFIPNRIVKEFVQELAPVFRDIHNLYLRATSLMLWRLITAEPNSQDLSTTMDWERSTAYHSDVYPCKVFTHAVWLRRCLTRSILANISERDIPPLTYWYIYSRQCMKQ